MRTVCSEKPAWRAASPRFILLGLITLLFLAAPGHGASSQPPAVAKTSLQGQPKVKRGLSRGPASLQCPLPPASVFSLQTNLRKYLETWPTPGSTTTEDWPEYIPEDGDGLD